MSRLSDVALPEGWVWATLESLLSPEPRAITDGPFGSNLKSAHYTDEGARVIRLQNVGDGFFRDELAYISMEHFETLRNHEVVEGDLILASLGEVLPRVAIVPELDAPAIVKADVIRARLHESVSTKWVLYALLSPQIRRYTASRIKGVGRPRLGLSEIRKLPIPVPPLNEQYRVVEALEAYLSRLDAARGDLHRSIIRLPAVVGGVRNVMTRGQKPGENLPAGWYWGTLNDVLERIEAGKSFRCEPRPATEDEWGVIKVSAMTWGEFRAGEQKAIPSGKPFDPRHEIKPGDILVSRANTSAYVGAPVLVEECRPRLLLSDKSLRLVAKPGIDKGWLIQALSSPYLRNQISAKATGTKDSMRNISQRELSGIRIPIPPADAQPVIGKALQAEAQRVDNLADGLNFAQERATHLRQALLRRAFTGQLVSQNPNDEPASELLDRIRAEREPYGARPKRTAGPQTVRRQNKASSVGPPPSPPASASRIPTTAVQQELPL